MLLELAGDGIPANDSIVAEGFIQCLGEAVSTDIDAFIAGRRLDWTRLDTLARANVQGASAVELDEMVRLYRRTSADLSLVQTRYHDPHLEAYLSSLVSRSRVKVYGSKARSLRGLQAFFTRTYPAAVARNWVFIVAAAAVFCASALAMGGWMLGSSHARDVALSPEQQKVLVDRQFAGYYSSRPAAEFSARIMTNNIEVAFTAFAAGMVFCVGGAALLALNGANLGMPVALFHLAHRDGIFWGLILPHGLLELTAIFIAAGAGLRLGWTLIDPGERRREQALGEEARIAVVMIAGVVLAFVVAALVEAFVTPSHLPTWGRVGIGVVVEVAYLLYLVVLGRRAHRLGLAEAPEDADVLPAEVALAREPV